MRRGAGVSLVVGVLGLGLALAGCTDGVEPVATPSPPSASPASAACIAYAGATVGARQVVTTASTKPVNGPFTALVLVNLRGITSTAEVPADPPLADALEEVTAAIDDLAGQLEQGLPAGADPTKATVAADPTRLGDALDSADALCSERGVAPEPATSDQPESDQPTPTPGATS